ncbi:hypothetical protein [Halomarina rubra]|uniref:Uncharacterized protein n=1 Tax=Halomarina rubra TaxID=2071873 RepID=A0ABD6AZZ0_9EURY|nr:hypothetical protein [Halomarina rubra]
MVRVEVRAEFFDAGEGVYHRSGDEIDVSESFADEHPYLVSPVKDDESEVVTESEDLDEAFQPEAFLDRTLDEGVVDDIEDGAVDEFLDQVEAHAERDGVKEAIEARRENLEE